VVFELHETDLTAALHSTGSVVLSLFAKFCIVLLRNEAWPSAKNASGEQKPGGDSVIWLRRAASPSHRGRIQ
jgi:hypothetical protein